MKQYISEFSSLKIAKLLSLNYIGAIVQGRAEAGPRALGNRSILADPRIIKNKDRINGLIKKRDAYQPLAPLCLSEDFNDFFVAPYANIKLDYMQCAINCKANSLIEIPAVIHSNLTARVQIITKKNHLRLYEILTEYKKITGIGVLINTSFNGKNEPIVNSINEVYMAYKVLDLDFLVIDNFLITRVNI